MEDKTLTMALLYDFFGDLLTEKQREYFHLYYNEDLSLGEIAQMVGISRQGVRDILVRAEGQLRELEEKTGIVRRFSRTMADLGDLEETAAAICRATTLEEAHKKGLLLQCQIEKLKSDE